MGNCMADRVAQTTCAHFLPDLVQTLGSLHQQISCDKHELEVVYSLHLELQELRARAEANICPGDNTRQLDHKQTVNAFCNWKVEQPWIAEDGNTEFLSHSSFGEEIATMTFHWMRSLKWPTTDESPLDSATGTTWVEMAISWMHYNRRYPPILRKDASGVQRVIFPGFFFFSKGTRVVIHRVWHHDPEDD